MFVEPNCLSGEDKFIPVGQASYICFTNDCVSVNISFKVGADVNTKVFFFIRTQEILWTHVVDVHKRSLFPCDGQHFTFRLIAIKVVINAPRAEACQGVL